MKTFLHLLVKSVAQPQSEVRATRRSRRFLPGCRSVCSALAVFIGLSITSAQAQVFVQEIAPADLVAPQFFGESISANATQFAVGTVLADKPATPTVPAMADAGAVYLFNLATGAQTRKLYSPSPEAGAHFGNAVALAGNLLAVSAPYEDTSNADGGAVYLFNAATGALLKRITSDTPNGTGNARQFGWSLAMAGDWLVIGAPFSFGSGVIYIYNLRTGIMELTFSPSGVSDEKYGWSVAVQGGLIAVGAPLADDGAFDAHGVAYLVDAATGAQLRRFVATDLGDNHSFGTSIAFARGRMIVGAPGWQANSGKVYAYNIGASAFPVAWASQGGSGSFLGFSVAGADDLVVVSAHVDFVFPVTSAGSVRVHSARSGTPVVDPLIASDPVLEDRFGKGVAVSGTTVLALAPRRDVRGEDSGSVFKFSSVRSRLPFTELALKNNSAPGAPDTAFLTFNQLAVSPQGFTTFDANVVGTGASLGRNSGIWSHYDFATRNVRRTGMLLLDPTPAPPAPQRKGVDFTNPVNNVNRFFGFTARTSGTGVTSANDMVFAVCDDTTGTRQLMLPLVEGTTTVGSGLLSTFNPPRKCYETGGAFGRYFAATYTNRHASGVTAANDSGVLHFPATGAGVAIREGRASAAGAPYGQILPRVAFPAKKVIFSSFLQGVSTATNLAVFSNDIGIAVPALARKGDDAPGFTSGTFWGTFSNFLGETHGLDPSIPQNGEVFRASVVPPTGSSTLNEGIWSRRNGSVQLAILKGAGPYPAFQQPGPLPAVPITIKSFLRFGSTLQDDIVIWVQLQGTGVNTTNDGAILVSRRPSSVNVVGQMEVLLREGSPAPGCGRARVGIIQTLDTGIYGAYVVLASLIVEAGGATTADNQALFLGTTVTAAPVYALPRLMLRKGMQFVRNGSPIVSSIRLPGYTTDATGAMDTGLARLVKADSSYNPTCSAVVTFNDGQTSVMSVFP